MWIKVNFFLTPPPNRMKLKIYILEPGQMVSTDKFVSIEKGILHHTQRIEKK